MKLIGKTNPESMKKMLTAKTPFQNIEKGG
jgi:hypothetical protein